MDGSDSSEYVRQAIDVLVERAKAANDCDRRLVPRFPFFCRVNVTMNACRLWAFSRDISATGIGLLHQMPLERGEATLIIPHGNGHLELDSEIMWCRSCGEGWHISGARFLSQ